MALQLNMDNPFAIMLMALIFTAKKDFKGALSLVINALSNFPSHYGLLVLRLSFNNYETKIANFELKKKPYY